MGKIYMNGRLGRSFALVGMFLLVSSFGLVIVSDFETFRREQSLSLKFETDLAAASQRIGADGSDLSVKQALRAVGRSERIVEEGDVLVRVVGDVAPVRMADIQLRRKGMGYAFSEMGEYFKEDDLTLVNLETPLIEGCPQRSEGMIFCGLPEFASEMRNAGIELVGLANNHIGNYGESGKFETWKHLEKASLLPIQNEGLVLARVKDTLFGVLAINDVVGTGVNRELAQKVLASAREQADIVIVSVHWGAEYELVPKAAAGVAPNDPRELGRWLVNQGADLVVGHHPHVVQGVEVYKDKFIAYSHGNFIFDQEWSRETKEGVIGNYVFREKKLVDVYFAPVVIEDWVRPRFADARESEVVLGRMRESSRELMKNE